LKAFETNCSSFWLLSSISSAQERLLTQPVAKMSSDKAAFLKIFLQKGKFKADL
jgi:hypothetical protein